jgi:hypothetical protein
VESCRWPTVNRLGALTGLQRDCYSESAIWQWNPIRNISTAGPSPPSARNAARFGMTALEEKARHGGQVGSKARIKTSRGVRRAEFAGLKAAATKANNGKGKATAPAGCRRYEKQRQRRQAGSKARESRQEQIPRSARDDRFEAKINYIPATKWPLPQARLTVDLGGPKHRRNHGYCSSAKDI